MPRKQVKVAAQFGHVQPHSGRGLTTVKQQFRAHRVSRFRRTFCAQNGTQHIGHMRQRNEFVPIGQVRLQPIKINQAVLGQRTHINMRADLFSQHLPWHNITVML